MNLDAAAVPQADEQQRVLANLILQMNSVRKPLPRFWYFPRGVKAVVVLTGEDRANGSTASRFDALAAASPAGCAVADWTCVRGTSYLGPATSLTDAAAAAYAAAGFELAPQVSTGCTDVAPSSLDGLYADRLAAFATQFPSLAAPATHRMHCSTWSDYATQPGVEGAHGLRLDTSYGYWPDAWLANRSGFITGSGMPMRFADERGAMIDVFQAAAQMTDYARAELPVDRQRAARQGARAVRLLRGAGRHTEFRHGVFIEASQIVNAAVTRGVPVVSARQMLEWLDGRNGSSFRAITWNGNTLSFSVAQGRAAAGLQAMLPIDASGTLRGITLNGSPVAFTTAVIKGVDTRCSTSPRARIRRLTLHRRPRVWSRA